MKKYIYSIILMVQRYIYFVKLARNSQVFLFYLQNFMLYSTAKVRVVPLQWLLKRWKEYLRYSVWLFHHPHLQGDVALLAFGLADEDGVVEPGVPAV